MNKCKNITNKYFFIAVLLVFSNVSCKQKTPEKLIGYTDIDSLITVVYPQNNVAIDTIFAGKTKENLFVYGKDTIAIENLFLPMFPGPNEKDIKTLKIIADTPYIHYKNKRWPLPYEWKSPNLQLNFLLVIKTKNKRYIATILSDPTAMGSFTRNIKVGLADLDNEGYTLPGYLTQPLYIKNFNNDDRIEFLSFRDMRNNTPAFTHYRFTICSFVEGFEDVDVLKNPEGQPLGFDFTDSAGKYYIREIRK